MVFFRKKISHQVKIYMVSQTMFLILIQFSLIGLKFQTEPHIRDTASCQFWLVSLALLYKKNSTATPYHLLVDGQIDF